MNGLKNIITGICTIFMLLVLPEFAYGQTGPGGVGSSDGTSALEFWLDAETSVENASSAAASDGEAVEYWRDRSGNSKDVQNTFGSNPVYRISGDTSYVDFSGGSAYMDGSSVVTGTTGRTFFTVVRPTSLSGGSANNAAWMLAPNNTSGTGYGLFLEDPGGSEGLALRVSGNKVMDYAPSTTKPTLIDGSSPDNANVTDTDFYANGTQITTLISETGATLNTNSVGVMLGGFSTGGDLTPEASFDYNGHIFELIAFSEELNTTKRRIVQNYLGSKYELTLGNDYYNYESNHREDVGGIGRVSSSDNHLLGYSDALGLSAAAADLADGTFVLTGHDGASLSFTTSEQPDGDTNAQKTSREWRVDITGVASEEIDMRIDVSGLSLPGGFNDYGIFVDSDGDFSSGATFYPVSLVSGSVYEAVNVTIDDGDYVTIGAVNRELTFTESAFDGFESVAGPTTTVDLNYISRSTVTIDVADDGTGTASASGVDYSFTTESLSFSPGTTSQTVSNLSVVNDTKLETSETVDLSLTNVSGANIGSPGSTTYTILDDDNPRKIQFTSTTSSGDESVSAVSIQVEINNVDNSNPTTVEYEVSGGTATGGGSDYTLSSGTATIASGETTTTIDVTIQEDNFDEGNETIEITLSNPSNANMGANTTHTYTIEDNDNPPSVLFSSGGSTILEQNTTVSITVELSAASGNTIEAAFSVDGASTASGSGVDYEIDTSSPLSFSPGTTSRTILVDIINDATEEGPEEVIIDITSATGADLGATTTHTLTINDDDEAGSRGPGGVGLTDGGSTLEFWLDAEVGVENTSSLEASDGENVEYWRDQSGNGKDMQNTFGSNPLFQAGDGQKYVDFSSGSAYMDGSSVITGSTGRTFFTVVQPTSLTGGVANNAAWTLAPNDTEGTGYSLFLESPGGNYGLSVRVSGNKAMDYAVSTSEPTVIEGSSPDNANVTDTDFYANGTEITTVLAESPAVLNTNSVGVILGGFSTGGDLNVNTDYDYNGYIYELIAFSEELNTTRRRLIQNYLSSKYGIATANDYFGYDISHPNDVGGIGRISVSDRHLTGYSDILGLGVTSGGLSNGEFLMMGHDSAAVSFSSSEAPNGETTAQKIGREWRADLTGTASKALKIKADLSGLSLPTGFNDYGIFIDSDGDFSNGAEFHPLVLESGSTYSTGTLTLTDGSFITIAAIKREISFQAGTDAAFESETGVAVTVELTYKAADNVSVDVNDTGNGTATDIEDYVFTPETVTVSAGSVTGTTTNLDMVNDTDLETTETIIFSLTNASGADLASPTTQTFSINDDDNPRKVQFTTTSSSGNESTTNVSIAIELDNVDNSNDTEVGYSATGGTATGDGTDYTLASGTATIPSGSTTGSIDFTVNNDLLNESDETVVITLSDPTNANLDTNTEHTYTIQDNDDAPEVSFAGSTTLAGEDAGAVSIEVVLTTASGTDVDVSFSVDGASTASGSGVDYTLDSVSPTTISTGSTSFNIILTINNDNSEESDEEIIINLTGATGATLGSTTAHTISILDDDDIGSSGPAGIGSVDGSSSLELWLEGDSEIEDGTGETPADGGTVEAWRDQSGNNADLQHSQGANPVFRSSGSYPYVDFSTQASDYLEGPSVLSGATGRTVFAVVQPTAISNTTSNSAFGLGPNSGAGEGYHLFIEAPGGSNGLALRVSGNEVMDYTTSTANPTIISLSSPDNADVIDTDFFANGTEITTQLSSGNQTLNTSGAGTLLGGFYSNDALSIDSNYDYNGYIYELIVYSEELSSTRRQLIENYLGSKYGIAVPNDYFSNATFDQNLIGVGRESDGIHRRAQGGGLVIRENGSLDSNGDYIMAGHDGTVNSDASDYLGNVSAEARWSREWVVEISGILSGSYVIGFDFSDAGLNFNPQNAENYLLLRRSNGTSDFEEITVSSKDISGDQILFTVPVGNLKTKLDPDDLLASGDQFTLGSSDTESSPLPVTLSGFAVRSGHETDIYPTVSWTTATERENFGFRLQRMFTEDAVEEDSEQKWENVTFVEGAGTTTNKNTYSFTDESLERAGKYAYRLVQIDYDGASTVYDPQEVTFRAPEKLELGKNYPNPFNPATIIPVSIPKRSKLNIEIYNTIGQKVATLVNETKPAGHYKIRFDASRLSSGMYFARMIYNGHVQTQKLILIK